MQATVTKPTKLKPDWKQIETLYLQGFLPQAISVKTGIGSNTIRVGLAKRGITKVRREQSATVLNLNVEASSRETRAKLAAEVERTLHKVSDCDPRRPEALNLHADTLQKVAKTAALVHGWGDAGATAVVVAGVLTMRPDDQPETQVIDVESGTEPATGDNPSA